MSSYILSEIAKREQAWQTAAVNSSPATATKVSNPRSQVEKLSLEAATLESAALDAANQITVLFEQRSDLQTSAEFLGRLEADVANLPTIANEALAQLVLSGPLQEKFGLHRWENAATTVSRLQVIAPILPAYTKKNAAELASVESQIRSVAKTSGVNLPGLIRELVAGGQAISAWTD